MAEPSKKKPQKLPRAVPLDPSGAVGKGEQPTPPPNMAQSRPTPKGAQPTPPPEKAQPTQPPKKAAPTGSGGESFDFGDLTRTHQDAQRGSRRRRTRQSPAVIAVAIVTIVVLIGGLAFWLGKKKPLVLAAIDDQAVDELTSLELTASVEDPGKAAGRIEYSLPDGPDGARIDPQSGAFTWRPSEEQGPERHEITVRAAAPGTRTIPAEQRFEVVVREVIAPLVLEPIEEKTVEPGGTLAFRVMAEDPDVPSHAVQFQLGPDTPPGARIGATTGRFQWTPQDAQPGQTHEITVLARKDAAGSPAVERTFRVRVEAPAGMAGPGPDGAIDQLVAALREEGAEVAVSDDAFGHPPLSGKLRLLVIDGQRVGVFGYAKAEAAALEAQVLTAGDLEPHAKLDGEPASAYLFAKDRLLALYVGGDPTVLNRLDGRLGRPLIARTVKPPAEKMPEKVAEASPEDRGNEVLLDLQKSNKLLAKKEYRTIRKVFADQFAREHADQIEQAFGAPDSELRRWLDEKVDIREEFYLAIDPEHDDVAQVLALFKQLREEFPEQFEPYANLAIAVAVVWDVPKKAIHGSPRGQHQSLPPEGEVGAVENFRYLLDAEDVMQGRAQFLPWEFLVHLVNHRTPLNERHWALTMYLPKRSMFGKCYSDVPYDGGMLEGMAPKLEGKPHTLPNIIRFGGVCSCQADFAARVGKSIGVPAFSVSGESRYGEGHGWVMWVELGRITKTGFTFSLESHGRYRGDHYYVGKLNDPHTGERTTDRDLERRLHTVGMDPLAKRQADLVMRAYPMLRERTEMDTTEQLLFLSRVIEFSPGNEEAWIALAKISREGEITKANSKPMMHVLDRLFTTFANLPDFTWVVFDDLVAFQDIPKQRAALFGRLAGLYEQAGRPDLSCEARLKFAEHLVADERFEEAIDGLAVAVRLFPQEGNFIPRILDRLEAICKQTDDGPKRVAQFYQEILPTIPQKRGNRPSSYCITMYERGIKHFRAAGLDQLVEAYEAQLLALEAQRDG